MDHSDNDKPDHGKSQQEQQPWPFPVRKPADPGESRSPDEDVIERTLPTTRPNFEDTP